MTASILRAISKGKRRRLLWTGFEIIVFCAVTLGVVVLNALGQSTVSDLAYQLLLQRAIANQSSFYVYQDADSGFNHGFLSGFFAGTGNGAPPPGSITLDPACIDDSTSANGCSSDVTRIDTTRGTVLRLTFGSLSGTKFVGLNIEEPENWGTTQAGNGYNLEPATSVTFDVRSPNGATVQFGVGGCNTNYLVLPPTWTTLTIKLDSLGCLPDLSNTHILFTVATGVDNSGTVLLDNIRLTPVPTRQTTDPKALSLPLSYQTFGVIPNENSTPTDPFFVFPPDVVNRNTSGVYEASLTLLALLARGQSDDLTSANEIANALDYALSADSHGDPVPIGPNNTSGCYLNIGSMPCGFHSAYESGDLALLNTQVVPPSCPAVPTVSQAGDVRLSGFLPSGSVCPWEFQFVLDDAAAGKNAFAILALVGAYRQFNDVRYLNDARTVGNWIVANLLDTASPSYGGYFAGYQRFPTPQMPFPPLTISSGKSTENNADLFAAFTALATVESGLGNSAAAAQWITDANVAGDFVMAMFDSGNGRFYAGTVPSGTSSDPEHGACPDNSQQQGNDVINACDLVDSNTIPTLAMAASARYQNQKINWQDPIQYVVSQFAQTVMAAGQTFQGLDRVANPSSGSVGVAWEYTGQAVETMQYVDQLLDVSTFASTAQSYLRQISQAQTSAPFGDGLGLVGSTLPNGDTLPPLFQCLGAAFQCIPERVGLAASAWAIFADKGINPFSPFPSAVLSATNLSFAAEPVGSSSQPIQVTLSNTGNVALAIASITASGDFTQTNNCGPNLAALSNCMIGVSFGARGADLRRGNLTIVDNAGGSPQIIALSGIGQDFTVSVSPNSVTVSPGASASYTLTLAPEDGFSGPVTVSCVGAPANASCTPVPASVPLNGTTPSTVTVTISTTASSQVTPMARRDSPNCPEWLNTLATLGRFRLWMYMAMVWMTILAWLCFVARSRRYNRLRPPNVYGLAALAALLTIVIAAGACGGGAASGGTNGGNTGIVAGTYTLTLSAAAGGLDHSITVNLVVQ